MKQHLYRYFDEFDTLIYVGISANAFVRFIQHKRDAPFVDQIRKITIEHFETRTLAAEAEYRTIKSEKPKYNRVNACRIVEKLEPKPLLSATKVAHHLGVTPGTMFNMIKSGRFPVDPVANLMPRRWRIEDVEAWRFRRTANGAE